MVQCRGTPGQNRANKQIFKKRREPGRKKSARYRDTPWQNKANKQNEWGRTTGHCSLKVLKHNMAEAGQMGFWQEIKLSSARFLQCLPCRRCGHCGAACPAPHCRPPCTRTCHTHPSGQGTIKSHVNEAENRGAYLYMYLHTLMQAMTSIFMSCPLRARGRVST